MERTRNPHPPTGFRRRPASPRNVLRAGFATVATTVLLVSATVVAATADDRAPAPPIHFDPAILDRDLDSVRIDPAFAAMVERLGDESFERREEAEAILLNRRIPLVEMLAILQRDTLGAEQRQRLLRIASRQVTSIPRGALGIRMETAREAGDGVVVSGFVAGMPAEDVLEIGDRIVTIEGVPTPTSVELISAVQSRLPGEVLRLEVVRRGDDGVARNETVDLVLGSVEQLGQAPGDPFARRNPVLAERAAFVAELGRRHGPGTLDVALEARPEPPAGPIDGHPELVRLRRYLEIVDRGVVTDPGALEILWQRRLARLRQNASDPRLGAAERAALREVIDRFESMLQDRG